MDPQVVRGLLVALVCLAIRLAPTHAAGQDTVAFPGAWTQAHHDARNSGRVAWVANLRRGSCPAWNARPNINHTYGHMTIHSDGAMDTNGDSVFYVGTSTEGYVLYQVDATTGSQQVVDTLTTPQVYAGAVGSVACGGQSVADGLATAGAVFYSFGPYVSSISPRWRWEAPFPVNAPLRLSSDGSLLLVAASNATADANGSLHALDASTGQEVWRFAAVTGAQSWGMRISPAITESGRVFVCFGNTIVVLDAVTGETLASATTAPLMALLGSSPTVTQDGTKVFVQSKSDDVWRFDVVTDSDGKISLQPAYVCSYTSLAPDCVAVNGTGSQVLRPDTLSPHFHAQLLGPKPVGGAPLQPGLQARHYKRDGTPVTDLGDDTRATIALGPNDESIIFPLYATDAGMGGVHSASTADGSRNWRYLSSDDSPYLGDMMGRSSPAVDADGYVFVGMDQVDPAQSAVPPVLLALDNEGNRLWVDGAPTPGPLWNPIGLRSPMLGYSSSETSTEGKVLLARAVVLQAFSPGQACPTTNPLQPCSGNGQCNCKLGAGVCSCSNPCFLGADCGTLNACNDEGFCEDGVCVCTSPCFSGPNCTTANTCSGRGTCGVSGCVCDNPCVYGGDCEHVQNCSGHGTCNTNTGVCDCTKGFSGPYCSQDAPSWFG